MILTNCAACAAPLAHDHKKRCSRCKTRYCNEACQRQHWERGGHEALCRRIKKGGGAEQYHADKKYKEAVAVAVEACAEISVQAYWTTLRDASAHGHAAGNAAARDVHSKAGFVLALCDAFRRVDESRE